jgi:hypothetical protein
MPTVPVSFAFELVADVVLEDGTKHRVGTFGPRDLVAFERQFKVPASFLGEMPRMEWIAFLAYSQLRHRKVVDPALTFDGFLDRLSDLSGEMDIPAPKDEGEEDEEPGPATEPLPSGSP